MTVYAASSITGYVPPGGVCKGHSIDDPKADPDYPYLSVSCAVCEPIITRDEWRFWATTPDDVPKTAAEERAAARQRAEADGAMANFSRAFMESFAAQQAAFASGEEL